MKNSFSKNLKVLSIRSHAKNSICLQVPSSQKIDLTIPKRLEVQQK